MNSTGVIPRPKGQTGSAPFQTEFQTNPRELRVAVMGKKGKFRVTGSREDPTGVLVLAILAPGSNLQHTAAKQPLQASQAGRRRFDPDRPLHSFPLQIKHLSDSRREPVRCAQNPSSICRPFSAALGDDRGRESLSRSFAERLQPDQAQGVWGSL